MHLKDNHSTIQDDHSSKHNKECHTHINEVNDSEDKSQDESVIQDSHLGLISITEIWDLRDLDWLIKLNIRVLIFLSYISFLDIYIYSVIIDYTIFSFPSGSYT